MFYKLDTDTNTYIDRPVPHFPGGIILDENNKIEHDGWKWYDELPIPVPTEVELWEQRREMIDELKRRARESVLAIPLENTFTALRNEISDFEANGSSDFWDAIQGMDDVWLDMREDTESPSPREVIGTHIVPYIL